MTEENELLEAFGNRYIEDAIRVVSTKVSVPQDQEMVYEALCILVAIYAQKIQDGEFKGRTLH